MQGSKILVVDDETAFRELVALALEMEGFIVEQAANGEEALNWVAESTPDLILCDVAMPRLSGHELLAELRKHERTERVPFIFLTGQSAGEDLRHGMHLGADDYLTKPVKLEDLVSAIKVRLEKKERWERYSEVQLERLRQRISGSVPHEIRTPLTALLGLAELLQGEADSMDRAEIKELAGMLLQSGKRLHRTLEKYILYSQLEMIAMQEGQMAALRKESAEFSSTKLKVAAAHIAALYDRPGDLKMNLEEGRVHLYPDHLTVILEELVDNAFKFSTPGSPVVVRSHADERLYSLVVQDSGRGMTAEQIREIGAFMQFEREHFEQQGPGMGLTIVKKLIEIYGGTFDVRSEKGMGTTLSMGLPIKSEA
ncbi:MAG TPA: hybrid sensor histidine kinase/response regulator [Bacteroidetes bacterium]|nr:hybrid sensor histidine kinase/response regulator [Bacteroidota bacterium]